MKHYLRLAGLLFCLAAVSLQAEENTNKNKFRQLYQEFRTPNVYRTASGAPGHLYWQQRADYRIDIQLDEERQVITGDESITYHNQSPDTLTYLWIQLDQNIRSADSDSRKVRSMDIGERMSFRALKRLHNDFDGGFKIDFVRDVANRDLHYIINQTMMRVDLPQPLESGASFTLRIGWWYTINNRVEIGGRSGYEYFEKDGNYLFTIAQFFPRMAVYNEVEGWQNKQFLGSGEFTLPFGNYKVSLTVPADHIVAATGILINAQEVLTREQQKRLEKARTSKSPVLIVTEEEARANEKEKSDSTRTWIFNAENVRDFAFVSSRKFIWDAMGVPFGDRIVMAMSFYPKEGNPLWEQYSTRVVAHTLKTYAKFTFDGFPYPQAVSVHTNRIGMEYPMICFNGGRPEEDGTYSERTKYGMISVIIHEVGHNFFPMIVNSDERQWTWMDEGLNTFLQYLTEQEWERDYPSRRGPAHKIVNYMKGDKSRLTPIMTNSESLFQFGNNAYAKPATALNILRETIMGRELFDFAFKQYAKRWMFKHPTPEDFFRTMEDASGVDLDWFWRGWFYTTDYVDLAIDSVKWFRPDTQDPEIEKPLQKTEEAEGPVNISVIRNREEIDQTWVEADPAALDFYNHFDPYEVTESDRKKYQAFIESLDDQEKDLLNAGYNYYEIRFSNRGGLVMPLILEIVYEDDTSKVVRIPAEIWRYNSDRVSKVFFSKQKIRSITLDPYLETADVDMGNNYWPPRVVPTRFELFKQRLPQRKNPMQLEREGRNSDKEDNS